ncbi:MAG: NAD(+) synthase [Thermoguttaceae bacterium]
MRLAVASLNQTPLDFSGNVARLRAAVGVAVQQNADAVVVSHHAIIGPDAGRHASCRSVKEHAAALAAEVLRESPIPIIFAESGGGDVCGHQITTPKIATPFLLGREQELPSNAGIVAVAPPLGCPAGRFIYDGVASIWRDGKCLTRSEPFSFAPFVLVVADIDSEPRATTVTPTNFDLFARCVALGLFDYRRKSGAERFVLSLSGGADSAAVAMLVHIANLFAANELDTVVPTSKTLTCVYQATANSSETTLNAARGVAEMIGATFHTADVQPMVDLYSRAASQIIGRDLSWDRDAASLQNIQARCRSPLAWMVANLTGGILLTTGNRSEATLGYCTMDGDTSGGLAPIGGIDKPFVRNFLQWLQRDGIVIGSQRHRFPKLACVTEQEPTAELLPPSAHQTDERDLMPYTLLNTLEKLVIGEGIVATSELVQRLKSHPQFGEWIANSSAAQLDVYVKKFLRLWQAGQWKRCRYAVAFEIDGGAPSSDEFGDYPILAGAVSGG